MTSSKDPTAMPKPDPGRPSPDVDRYETDGQSRAGGKGSTDQQGKPAKPMESGLDAPHDQGEGDNIPGP